MGKLGRLRDVVRQHLVATQLASTLPDPALEPKRVLDVGCGQGTQALILARAGHTVIGLDPSTALLERFRSSLADETPEVRERVKLVEGAGEHAPDLVSGPFDVVCCHGLLMYLSDPWPLLEAITALAGPGARLSPLVRNGLALAMRPGLLGHAEQALEAFEGRSYTNRLGVRAVAHTPDEVDTLLQPLSWKPHLWFGVRVFTDHREEATESLADDELTALLDAEENAGRTDPYRQVSALCHLFYQRNR